MSTLNKNHRFIFKEIDYDWSIMKIKKMKQRFINNQSSKVEQVQDNKHDLHELCIYQIINIAKKMKQQDRYLFEIQDITNNAI